MEILLINPPENSGKDSLTLIGLPLGLLYVAAILEQRGKNVEIFDSITYNKRLQEQDIGKGLKHVGASWKRIEKEIIKKRPDIVGISNHFSSQIENTLKVAEIAKKINKKIKVIVGGPHASSFPEDFFKQNTVDFAITGEGEFAFAKLIDGLENEKKGKKAKFNKINNLVYMNKGKIKVNPLKHIENLDDLPIPAYHLINMDNYFNLIKHGLGRVSLETKNYRRISMITSRGCPFNCTFCSIHCHMGRKWRAHSSEYVIKHILYLVKNYGINHIGFEDDNLTLDITRFERILNGIIKNKIKITWDTPNGIRADMLDYNLLKKMKKMGCSSIKIGVESGDQEVIDKIVGKSLDLKKVIRVSAMCKKLNIPLTAFFIIGFPGETKGNIKRTLNFAYMLKKKYYVDSVITIAMPLVGTRMYDISKKNNYLVRGHNPSEFGSKDGWVIETENFDLDYLKSERKKFYKKIVQLQLLQLIKKPSMVIKYLVFLKNPKNTINILNYLTNTK